MQRNYQLLFAACILISLLLFHCAPPEEPVVSGDLKKWHKVTIDVKGPLLSEMSDENPFLDYRLDVTFAKGDQRFLVPGYFAADGNAAETGAEEGPIWKVHFTPNEEGIWNYSISFKKGSQIAVSSDFQNATSASNADGQMGSFEIGPNDKSGIDNRAKGRLQYVGEPYLRYAETEEYLIKVGVDAPENLFAYEDFDATPNVFDFRKSWSFHAEDFPADASEYVWQEDLGKELLGAIHYLSTESLNVFSFLTFNVDGDDRNVFPYLLKVPADEYEEYASVKDHRNAWDSLFHKTRLDVSKLAQWERILEFAETRGMFLHFKTHETETDHLMDGGDFGTEGKLYYRELIARFGHHLALNWNLGEENNQPIEQVRKIAQYIRDLDPYDHHMVIHTFPNQDDRYGELIGNQSELTGASLQLSDAEFFDVHGRVLKWRQASMATGKPWALAVDEPGKANIALLPDEEDPEHYEPRARALWGTLMAGGYGVEWYFGYQSPHSDLTCEDFRSRDLFWDQNRSIRTFFESYLPFWEMEPADSLSQGDGVYVLDKPQSIAAIYFPRNLNDKKIRIDQDGLGYQVQWYNPRANESLVTGTIQKVMGPGWQLLGQPPVDPDLDWVALLTVQE